MTTYCKNFTVALHGVVDRDIYTQTRDSVAECLLCYYF